MQKLTGISSCNTITEFQTLNPVHLFMKSAVTLPYSVHSWHRHLQIQIVLLNKLSRAERKKDGGKESW